MEQSHLASSVVGSGLQRNGLPPSQNSPVLIDPPLLPVWLSHLYFLPGYWPINIYLKYNWQNTDHSPMPPPPQPHVGTNLLSGVSVLPKFPFCSMNWTSGTEYQVLRQASSLCILTDTPQWISPCCLFPAICFQGHPWPPTSWGSSLSFLFSCYGRTMLSVFSTTLQNMLLSLSLLCVCVCMCTHACAFMFPWL